MIIQMAAMLHLLQLVKVCRCCCDPVPLDVKCACVAGAGETPLITDNELCRQQPPYLAKWQRCRDKLSIRPSHSGSRRPLHQPLTLGPATPSLHTAPGQKIISSKLLRQSPIKFIFSVFSLIWNQIQYAFERLEILPIEQVTCAMYVCKLYTPCM